MEGLLDRSWVAGVTPGEILLSHVITQFVVMCGQTALVLIFMILVFNVECKGDIGWVIVLTILQGLCGMCFGKIIRFKESLLLLHEQRVQTNSCYKFLFLSSKTDLCEIFYTRLAKTGLSVTLILSFFF